jgi:hypothetical protein
MKDQLISFETAKLAKEKGFNQGFPYMKYVWNDNTGDYIGHFASTVNFTVSVSWVSAPSQSLLQKWLREEKGMNIVPPINYFKLGYSCSPFKPSDGKYFETYELALENELIFALNQLP